MHTLNRVGIFLKVVQFLLYMLVCTHYSGCTQFYVARLQGFPDLSWVVNNELENANWFEQYTTAFFQAFSHQMSIGYGRFPPITPTDTWVTIVSQFVGGLSHGIFIGHANYLIQSLDSSKRQYREKWKQVEEYMLYRR